MTITPASRATADIADNLDPVRLARLPAVVAKELESKYAAALATLR